MNWGTWNEVETHLVENGIRPILAIVPDNQDASLRVGPSEEGFWERARSWQSRGWTLALHGFQHLYTRSGGGLLGLHARSEFAGYSLAEQEAKLRAGLGIMRREGILPQVWVAPGHSFDATTLEALAAVNLRVVSDGFTIWPFTDARGLTWIPQQLWGLTARPFGVWTACYHTNEFGAGDLKRFRRQIREFQSLTTSVPDLLQEFAGRRPTWLDFSIAWWLRQIHITRGAIARVLRAGIPVR